MLADLRTIFTVDIPECWRAGILQRDLFAAVAVTAFILALGVCAPMISQFLQN